MNLLSKTPKVSFCFNYILLYCNILNKTSIYLTLSPLKICLFMGILEPKICIQQHQVFRFRGKIFAISRKSINSRCQSENSENSDKAKV